MCAFRRLDKSNCLAQRMSKETRLLLMQQKARVWNSNWFTHQYRPDAQSFNYTVQSVSKRQNVTRKLRRKEITNMCKPCSALTKHLESKYLYPLLLGMNYSEFKKKVNLKHLLAIMIVLEFPPRLSFNSQVNTESL